MLHPTPLWEREDLRAEQVVAEFQREARMVRKAVTGDLTKVSCVSLYKKAMDLLCTVFLAQQAESRSQGTCNASTMQVPSIS